MENNQLESLLQAVTKELGSLFSSRTVVGEPLELHGRTIIPLVSVGFGTGMGAGHGGDRKSGEGTGSAVGIGGGVRPVALLISDENGVRIEAVKGGAASAAEHVAEAIAKVMAERNKDASRQPLAAE
jgi:uncharacterized spore protein YtfJ